MSTPKLRRPITTYLHCYPKAMAEDMSVAARIYAFDDMRADVITLARLLCEAGYPRRGTSEETQSMQDFANKVQKLISHNEAVEL
jgi:hypothetical protein